MVTRRPFGLMGSRLELIQSAGEVDLEVICDRVRKLDVFARDRLTDRDDASDGVSEKPNEGHAQDPIARVGVLGDGLR